MTEEYIKQSAALTELCRGCSIRSTKPDYFCGEACPKYERIAGIPADAVRPAVMAEWNSSPGTMYAGWVCTACGRYVPEKENFCPGCVADMKGKQNERAEE